MEKINIAVLGLGGMGGTHVGAAKASPYVDKIYGYEPDPVRREARAKELDIIPATLEEILADPSIKMVSIAASNDAHVPLAEASLRAGKAVLCEKPMGDTLEEAEHLIKVKNETNGWLQIGFELHYSKMYQKVKEWIDEGKLGDVVNVQCRYYCCEFHKKNNWRSNSTGSFLIGEKLSHYLDLQRWYFGETPQNVYSLSAAKVVDYFHHRDNHQILTRYPDGKIATLNFIMYIAESHTGHDPLRDLLEQQVDDGHYLQYHICGTKGAIETDVFRRRIRRWEFGDSPTNMTSKIVEVINFDKSDDQEYFHNVEGQNIHVIELIAKGKPSEMTAQQAYETMKLCFAAELSEDTGELIDFNDARLN